MTSVVKVVTVTSRESKAAVERRARMKRFGAAAQSVDDSNVTIRTNDEETVTLEAEEGHAQQAAVKDAMNEFAKKQMRRKLMQKYEVGDDVAGGDDDDDHRKDDGAAKDDAPLGAQQQKSTYVLPAMRGKEQPRGSGMERMAAGAHDDRDHATLRVTNISEDTAEQDLQILFKPYGNISRIYLAKDRETHQSRGFAFVSFVHREDAARAMDALQGHGYDHLILKIEWAKPSTREPNQDGGLSSGFTSGYGKALAQDTKQRVSYASNLTQNR